MGNVVKFQDIDTERYFLAACLQGPEYWKSIPDAWLNDELAKMTYKELKRFLEPPFSSYPSRDLALEKCNSIDVKLFVAELSSINVDKSLLNAQVYDLYQMYANRKLYDLAKNMINELNGIGKAEDIVRKKITELSDLVNPFEVGLRKRAFVYEDAAARWELYRKREKEPNQHDKIPYHIEEFDKYTNGGIKKSHINCFFAGSGGYKTKLKANLAYNFAFLEKKDVMVITLEVPIEDYATIIDSRHALLDFNEIQRGALGPNKEQYRKALIEMYKSKPNLYIVDIPGNATSMDIPAEAEIYYAKFGKYPDVVILDYANEMEPVKPWNNSGEKYKNLGVENRQVTRSYGFAFITSFQENREGKKIKDKTKVGTEHMSESHSYQNVCHLVAYLYQDEGGVDAGNNQLHVSFKKNRYGEKHVNFSIFASPAYNYIGDRQIHLVNSSSNASSQQVAGMLNQQNSDSNVKY
jgi:replicative DNA helicase